MEISGRVESSAVRGGSYIHTRDLAGNDIIEKTAGERFDYIKESHISPALCPPFFSRKKIVYYLFFFGCVTQGGGEMLKTRANNNGGNIFLESKKFPGRRGKREDLIKLSIEL